jgi:hypothetical protein
MPIKIGDDLGIRMKERKPMIGKGDFSMLGNYSRCKAKRPLHKSFKSMAEAARSAVEENKALQARGLKDQH